MLQSAENRLFHTNSSSRIRYGKRICIADQRVYIHRALFLRPLNPLEPIWNHSFDIFSLTSLVLPHYTRSVRLARDNIWIMFLAEMLGQIQHSCKNNYVRNLQYNASIRYWYWCSIYYTYCIHTNLSINVYSTLSFVFTFIKIFIA